MPPETIWTAYLKDLCHTNTTASEIVEVITLILSELISIEICMLIMLS
jgi:hypothetical protein